MSVQRHILPCPPATIFPAANDQPLVRYGEPSLMALLADLGLLRALIDDGLTLDHLSVLHDCANRSAEAFKTISN